MAKNELMTAELKPVSGTQKFRDDFAVTVVVESVADALEKQPI